MTPTGLRFNSCTVSVPAYLFVTYPEYMDSASKPIMVERKVFLFSVDAHVSFGLCESVWCASGMLAHALRITKTIYP